MVLAIPVPLQDAVSELHLEVERV